MVVGDVLLDRDITGRVERLSPEGPVPVVSGVRSSERPGGAGMAAVLAAREPGWRVTLVCGLGQDEPGARVRALLRKAGVEVVSLAPSGATPLKTRVRAADRTLLRFDADGDVDGDVENGPADSEGPGAHGDTGSVTAPRHGPLPPEFQARLAEASAVLVCDYGRGITAREDVRRILTEAATSRPLVWDPHPQGAPPVPGTALAVPNADEAIALTGCASPRDLKGDATRAVRLLARWPVKQVAVTRGGDGAVLVSDPDSHPLVVPTRQVAGDTCGAGDRLAVTAALVLGTGRLPSHAIAAAVDAATRYVASNGPASLTAPPDTATSDPRELAARVRERGGRVVAAGGCFDLLHAGHLALLEQAHRLGDILLVCLNSDASVRRLKGESRPVVGERERAMLLRALDCVDGVLVFDEDTPERVLAELRPDIWVKGGDYTGRRVPEAGLVESWGGSVVTVPYLDGHSTTLRIDRLTGRAAAQ
ncbi:D-glycero-beta-D-manno-heptose 1-phosphate adenylyltransferase [Streptomyces roseoviridis]|uniref:D-glycero-beta-D-manno-heptose 1-phosphate adenylyltransferase n=1 Tax=Streptomyces roseoviridis TaxID=67361 RepID=A0ABV5QRP7_9ACTN